MRTAEAAGSERHAAEHLAAARGLQRHEGLEIGVAIVPVATVIAALAIRALDRRAGRRQHIGDGHQLRQVGLTAGDGAGLRGDGIEGDGAVVMDPPGQVAQGRW
jgi:hypothetical protein